MLTMPQMLVLDEPTGGLDEPSKKEFIGILNKLDEDMLVIAVTHDDYYIKNFESTMIRL